MWVASFTRMVSISGEERKYSVTVWVREQGRTGNQGIRRTPRRRLDHDEAGQSMASSRRESLADVFDSSRCRLSRSISHALALSRRPRGSE